MSLKFFQTVDQHEVKYLEFLYIKCQKYEIIHFP